MTRIHRHHGFVHQAAGNGRQEPVARPVAQQRQPVRNEAKPAARDPLRTDAQPAAKAGQRRKYSGGRTELNIGSFNVLGSSHTKPGGEKPGKASGPARVRLAAKAIAKHDLDIVGFQEMQKDQLREFQRVTKHKFGVYPGFKLQKGDSVNSIAWRRDKWDLVKPGSIKVPYFNGHRRNMPVVLLRNKQTGQKAYFLNVHNPADTRRFHHQERFRDKATKMEMALVNRLKKTGLPVFFTGDMNEKQEFANHMKHGTQMHAAIKGPHSHTKKIGIDWIYGSKDVHFSGYTRDQGALVRKASDHPLIYAHATIPPRKRRAA